MCKESIVLKLPCRWSRYHMLRNGSPSKSFNGSIIERKTADTTIPWHGMSEGPECVVFNSHTSTDYVLEGAELSASSDSWAGNWVCLGRAAWLRSETPLGPGLISVVLRLPPPVRGIVARRLLRFTRGMDGPLLPLDEHSLMAASLKADGPVWGGVSFTSLQLALAGHSSGCLALLSCPHDGAPRGWNVCHLFYFQIKVDDLPIKSKNSLLMMSGGIWRKCCNSDIFSTLSEITKDKRDLSFLLFFCISSDKE